MYILQMLTDHVETLCIVCAEMCDGIVGKHITTHLRICKCDGELSTRMTCHVDRVLFGRSWKGSGWSNCVAGCLGGARKADHFSL